MTKGIPAHPRSCLRCSQTYRPTSGPQKYCVSCIPIMHRVYSQEWRRRNPDQRKLIDKRAQQTKPEYYRQMRRYIFHRKVEELRQSVLGYYSWQRFRCACCGETERDFLVIDHIDGHGNRHRKEIFGRPQAGYRFYDWLVKHEYPPGFQVLCNNCNLSKGKHGACVHVSRPSEPNPPPGMKTINHLPADRRPNGSEARLVNWRPRLQNANSSTLST